MNYIIVLISILVLIISVRLFRMAAGSMSMLKMNTVSYVFYFQLITSGIVGSVLLATGVLDYHQYAQELSDSVKLEAWAWVMYTLLAIPASMLILNKIFKVHAVRDYKTYLKKEIEITGSPIGKKMVLLFMVGFSVLILLYVLLNTAHIPLLTVLRGESGNAAVDRLVAKNQFGGIEHIRSFFGLILMPVFAYYAYIELRKERSFFNLTMFGLLFLLTSFLLVYDIQKAPIAFFILGFWIVEVLISGGINLKTAMVMIGLPVGLILVGYALTTNASFTDQFLRFNSAFYGRTFVTGYFAFPLSLELFPDVITEETYYSGIPMAFRTDGNMEAARALMVHMNPEGVKAGTANLFSGFFMGEAWANYGYAGLISAPLIVGAVIQSAHVFLLKQVKEPLIIAFYALISTHWLVGSGFVNFLFLKLIIFPAILFFATKWLINKIKFVA